METEEFELKRKLETPVGNTPANRDRLHLIEQSSGHLWDEFESLWKEVARTDVTTLPGVFTQVLQAWYWAQEASDPKYAVELRQMERLFMSVTRYLIAETGMTPEDLGAKGFFIHTTREMIDQGCKAA